MLLSLKHILVFVAIPSVPEDTLAFLEEEPGATGSKLLSPFP